MAATQTWIVLSDFQIPFHDVDAVKLTLAFASELKPYGVILNGDVVDCYSLSDFDKNPLQKASLQTEIELAGKLMGQFQHVKERIWLGGNHEDRLRRVIWRNPAFAGLKELEFPQLFHLADYGFKWKEYGDVHRLGKLSVTHGDTVRASSGATARAHFEKFGGSVLHGHTHRLGAYYRTNGTGTHGAWENGCLCRLDPEYVKRPDWQQGFSVVHVGAGGAFNVQQVPILPGYGLFYGDRRFGWRK